MSNQPLCTATGWIAYSPNTVGTLASEVQWFQVRNSVRDIAQLDCQPYLTLEAYIKSSEN